MVRLSLRALCSSKGFKYWDRWVDRETFSKQRYRKWCGPLVGWKEIDRHWWSYNEHRPWTAEFQEHNRAGKNNKRYFVEPIKDWSIFKGDRLCVPRVGSGLLQNNGSQTAIFPRLAKQCQITLSRSMHTNMSGTTEGSTYPSDNNTQDTLTQNASSSNPKDTNSQKAKIYEGVLLGLGNPLLDMTITTDKAFLEKYDLKANDAIIAEKKHEAMFEEITERYKPMFVAGGATQNTMRVAQWLLGVPKSVTFVGCVGKDAMGSVLKETAENVGVGVHYQIHESKNTGKCGAIITGENRSLVTSLGAARSFTHNFINEHWELIERAKFFYIGGFVFPVSAESIKEVAEHTCDTDKTLIMNLSAPFLCEYFADPDIGIMQYIDILFGNETEAAKFCGLQGIKADTIQEMALKTAALPKKNTGRERIVIFTQGRDPTIIATDGRITEHPICPIEKDLIKDTNGCGDAFVGGFLSQLVQGASLDECLRCGNYAARTVIQYFGCTYPSKPDFK